MKHYYYQVGGCLEKNAASYVIRDVDREIYQALEAGEFCYLLNSRQMGKSSVLVRTLYQFQASGYRCSIVDMTRIGSENITPEQWYKGIVADLWRGFGLFGKFNLKAWWSEQENVSLLQQLSNFVETVLFKEFPEEKIIIFIDEIDSILSLKFPVDDFFAWIRFCYNQRAVNPEYQRITFAIFGVATPSDLIADKNRTPFNIGKAISLQGFQLAEIAPLTAGLVGKVSNPQRVLAEILNWTGGQPFLTQKLCQLLLRFIENPPYQFTSFGAFGIIPEGKETEWIGSLVQQTIIAQWEGKDEPEHLKTIRDRLLLNEQKAGRLLGLYQQILQGVEVPTDDSREQVELLLSGLVVKQAGLLKVKNRIYQAVFNLAWVEKQLRILRPYSQGFEAWMATGQQDPSRLLRGQALKEAQTWAQGKSLSDLDYQFLAASAELENWELQQNLEAATLKAVAAQLAEEKRTIEQQIKSTQIQRFCLVAVSSALAIAIAFGMAAYWQYRQAALNEIKAIAISSQALFASSQQLDALIAALKAEQKLQRLGAKDRDIQTQVHLTLRRAVYRILESNRLSGHNGTITAVAFSPDGKAIATASGDNTVKLWQRDGQLLGIFSGHRSAVYAVAFSPDGNWIASGSGDGTIKLWGLNGREMRTIKAHEGYVNAVAFSPDGQTLVSGSDDTTVKLWRMDGTLLQTFPEHQEAVADVAFSPDGNAIATASSDKTLKLWNIDGTLIKTFRGHQGKVWAVAFSPDGEAIASASEDTTVKLWRRDGSVLNTFNGHSALVRAIAFSPDGQIIASASEDKTVKLWRRDGSLVETLNGHSAGLWTVAFSPDGNTIASGGWDNITKLWRTDHLLRISLKGHREGIWGVAFSSDSQIIASASRDSTIKLWTRDGTFLRSLQGHRDGVLSVVFSADHQILASASRDRTIKLWQLNSNQQKTLKGHSQGVSSIALSPDGQILASGSWDNTVKLWQLDGTPLATLRGHRNAVWGIAFSPDGNTIASASDDQTIKLWKKDNALPPTENPHYRLVRTLQDRNRVWAIAFSPDGNIIASAGWDHTIKLWTLDGRLLKIIPAHRNTIYSLAFSPDGKIVASASADKTIKLWQLDGTEIATLNSHDDGVRKVVFSPDGKTLASASDDKTLILWNLDQAVPLNQVWVYGCQWLQDYLHTNPEVNPRDRQICDRR